jgi:hypothetical protein
MTRFPLRKPFDGFGDVDVVTTCARLADALAARGAEPLARERLNAFKARRALEPTRLEADHVEPR